MTPFARAVSRVFSNEGGYANNPRDPGGETMWGITLRVARAHGYTGEMRFLPKETALSIYEREYWLPIRGDELPFPVAYQLFDFSANSGPIQAIRSLQTTLGVKVDGVFGPRTLTGVESVLPAKLSFSLDRKSVV